MGIPFLEHRDYPAQTTTARCLCSGTILGRGVAFYPVVPSVGPTIEADDGRIKTVDRHEFKIPASGLDRFDAAPPLEPGGLKV